MRPPLLLAFVFLLSCTLLPFSLSEKCHRYDKQALLKFKKDFGNPYVFTSWDPKTDCCDGWYGVYCDQTSNRVTSVYDNSADSLSGPIPASIANLPLLEALTFTNQPKLTGPVPPAIAKLKNLNSIWISGTNISGPVPEFLSQLKKLTYINLSVNNLTGSIPSSLSLLPNLDYLNLERNRLTGPIPETFGEFKTPDFILTLDHNQLSGKIPVSLGKVNFSTFDFSWNKLEGDVSMLFGALMKKKDLWSADLSRNLLEFNLSNMPLPPSLHYLYLNHNKITGRIPKSWTRSASLTRLNVSYNMLCGQIPVGGVLQVLDYTNYFHNKCLCGTPLPKCN